MVAKAPLLIEQVPEFEQREGLFYVTVKVGGEDMQFVARPHTFIAGARNAGKVGREFMAAQSEPLQLTG